jgi:hypothetical protein
MRFWNCMPWPGGGSQLSDISDISRYPVALCVVLCHGQL